ncbi:MAG: hypothetical protein ABI779_23170 [Acidobacteriota bacterium]
MADMWGAFLRLVGLQKAAKEHLAVTVYRKGGGREVVRVPPLASRSDAREALAIAEIQEKIAVHHEGAAVALAGATQAAGDAVKIADETTLELTVIAGRIDEAVADNDLASRLRPDRDEVARLQLEKERAETAAAATIAQAEEKVAEMKAKKIIEEATQKYAPASPPNPELVAADLSRAEQEEAVREWAILIVGDVAAWTYPVEGDDGYLAYAAIQYFGPRLEGKSHDEATESAVDQLIRHKQSQARFTPKQAEDMAVRANAMWRKFKRELDEAKVQAQKGKVAETILDAARQHHQTAARLHDLINGGESNEEFDATK